MRDPRSRSSDIYLSISIRSITVDKASFLPTAFKAAEGDTVISHILRSISKSAT